MKKLISILLVAMLIIGMFPATALTASAATEIVFNLGNNGSAAHKDGSSAQTTYTETVGGYTLSITNGAKMYPASYDAKGNSCIKLGAGSAVGGFSFTVPSDVTGVKIEVAMYKANTSKINVNGTAYTLTKASDNGEYDVIEVSTLSNKTVSLTTVSGGVRAMVNTITFVIDSGTSCDHSLTETIPGVAATCTEPGVEEAQSCVCGENKVGGAAIDPLGHEYADGACARCEKAMVDPSTDKLATLLTELPGIGDTVAIYYPVESLAMTAIADGNRLAPVLAELQDGKMPYNDDVAQLTFGAEGEYYTFANADGQYLVTGATGGNLSFADELTDAALWSIAANGTNTWNITNKAAVYNNQAQAIEYYNGFTTYGLSTSNTVYRMALYLIAESVCEHANKTSQEDGFAATCTEAGKEDSYVCDDCGANFPGATIDPLGHNFVNGTCNREDCGAVKPAGMTPATTLVSGEYVIVAVDEEGNYALPLGISGKMNGTAVTVDADGVLTGDNLPVWTVEVTDAGITLYNGEKYLGYGSSTDLGAKDTAFTWTATAQDGAFVIEDAGTGRCVIFQVRDAQQDRFRFGAYKTGQTSGKYIEALTFYPLEAAAEKEPVVEMDGVQYGSFEEAYQQDPDTTIKLLAPIENINVTGDLYLDLNGFTASVDGANAIFAGDSSATATTAGKGKLTTTAPVIIDNTVNGVRYIALEEQATRSTESTYTFHVLELKLTHVTLRASEDGLYYKAAIQCDEVLAAATEYHGLVVSINNMPGADFASTEEEKDNNGWTKVAGAPEGGNLTSCSVFGIFKTGKSDNAERGQQKIYANAYIQLKDKEQTILVADTKNVGQQAGVGRSLRDVMEALDTTFPTLDLNDEKQANQRETLLNFYKEWSTAMQNWNIDNIKEVAQ